MRRCLNLLFAPTALSFSTLLICAQTPPIQMQQSNSTASLRGIHAAGPGVAWASGTNGTVLRTEDAGFVWQSCALPPGAEKLDFRGVWAWDAQTAIVMSSGPGEQSRLYKTTNGCMSWKLLLTNTDKDGFWDAIAFFDAKHGVLLGDPVNGHFVVLSTQDGGEHWTTPFPGPLALVGSGIFAASNSSLVINASTPGQIAFGSGGNGQAQSSAGIYHRSRRGEWGYRSLPIASSSKASGVFSLAYRTPLIAVAAGGDYEKPNVALGTLAWTEDAGKHWTAATQPPHGYRSAVAWDPGDQAWVIAGPNGTDFSRDDGRTWLPLENGKWNAISLPYLVGPTGRIGKLVSLPAARGPAAEGPAGRSPVPAGQNAHSGKP